MPPSVSQIISPLSFRVLRGTQHIEWRKFIRLAYKIRPGSSSNGCLQNAEATQSRRQNSSLSWSSTQALEDAQKAASSVHIGRWKKLSSGVSKGRLSLVEQTRSTNTTPRHKGKETKSKSLPLDLLTSEQLLEDTTHLQGGNQENPSQACLEINLNYSLQVSPEACVMDESRSWQGGISIITPSLLDHCAKQRNQKDPPGRTAATVYTVTYSSLALSPCLFV